MQYIQLQAQATGATPTPGEGKYNFFIDEADGQPKIKDDNGTIITVNGVTQTLTSLTYFAFIELIMNSELTKGYFYEINDYQTCYDQPDFSANGNAITTGNYKTSGVIQPIIVFATASDQISTDAFQAAYPKDKIKYDWTFGSTEVTGNPAKGRIIERIDEFNNRTDYDHRNILFKRYDMYYPNQKLPGTLTMVDGLVTGVDTEFSSLSTGDRIYINDSGLEYMITAVTGDTRMIVTGITYNNVNGSYFSTTNSITGYKRNNTSSPTGFTEHYTFDLDNDDDNYYINNYIGNYANLREWDDNSFYLANNVFIGGDYINNKIGDNSYNNTFDDSCKNNVIGVGFYNNTTNDDFDDNFIGENFNNNIITAEFDYNRIGNDFENNIIICDEDFDDNQIGNDFQNNIIRCEDFYRNQIGNYFNENYITGGDDFQNNVIGNQFNENTITQEFIKNRIGNGYNDNEILVDFTGNIVGNGFNNNNITGGEFYDNIIGQYFEENTISANFNENSIGDNFDENDISFTGYTIDFTNNQIFNDFENNTITVDFRSNKIDSEFKGNMFNRDVNDNGSVIGNNIGYFMAANEISGEFDDNIIGNNFLNNDIFGAFYKNQIGVWFESNTTQDEFAYNVILNDFYNNTIGEYFGFGYNSDRGNIIGNSFEDNTIRDHFYDNKISDGFRNNLTPTHFQYNEIKYPVDSVDFASNNKNIDTFSRNSPTSTASNGNIDVGGGTSSGDGQGATFQVNVSGGTIQNVVLLSPGYDYEVSDTITIPSSSFNGSGDLVITVTAVTPEAMVTGDYNCKISKSVDGGLLISTETLNGLYTQSEITEIFLD
jgi:hypothetical protein